MKMTISLILTLVLVVSGCNAPPQVDSGQPADTEALTESVQKLETQLDKISSRMEDLSSRVDELNESLGRFKDDYEERLGLTNKDLSIQSDRIDDISIELSIELDSIKDDINDLKRTIHRP